MTLVDLHKRFSQHNLNIHIRYYNEHKRLVSNEIVHLEEKLGSGALDTKERQELEILKHIYLNSYHHCMMTNCFLMMYSHFEECLGNTCDLVSNKMPESQKSGLDRFKEHFKTEHKVNLPDGPHWPFLRDCEKARHVLLHAGGNITLARDPGQVDEIIKRNRDCFETQNKRLVPRETLLVEFSQAIADFTEWLIDQTKQEQM